MESIDEALINTPATPCGQWSESGSELVETEVKHANDWDETNLRHKKLSSVRLFVQLLNEIQPEWREDAGLVRRTFEWAKRAATD